MADDPHDVGLIALFVEGVAHGFTVDGEAFVDLTIGCIPTLQGAIERLGARLDGILRSHQRHSNGSLRDTCVYSIIAAEWPAVKGHLAYQLSRKHERHD